MSFVDGAPLEASMLADLENKLALVEGRLPNLSDKTLKNPQILAKKSSTFSVEVGKLTEKILPLTNDDGSNFFSKAPIVVATVSSPKGKLTDDKISITIGEVSTSSATLFIYYDGQSGTKAGTVKPIAVNYIAMAL